MCLSQYVSITDMMKTDGKKAYRSLSMRSIFRYMMEEGYYPTFEKSCIMFNIADNTAVVEYEEGILSVRIFFSIDKENTNLFLKASNGSMLSTFLVRPIILDEKESIMFSCETICDTLSELRKFFPRLLEMLIEGLEMHKAEMKDILIANQIADTAMPASEEYFPETGISRKILS